jgi:hypothetical protein
MRRAFWALTVGCAAPIPKEALMRIPALAILMIATVLTAAPARAQTYNPDYPVCLQVCGIAGATSHAAIPRWRSALSRHRAARPSASSIHILRPRKCLRERIIGGIAASTKCLAAPC